MRTIHKFQFKVDDTVTLEMPKGAVIRAVGKEQASAPGHLALWAEVDTDEPMERRAIFVRGTGHPLPLNATQRRYIGMVQDGGFVWHVFEKRQPVMRVERGGSASAYPESDVS